MNSKALSKRYSTWRQGSSGEQCNILTKNYISSTQYNTSQQPPIIKSKKYISPNEQ